MGVPIDRGLTQHLIISFSLLGGIRVEMDVPIDRGLTHKIKACRYHIFEIVEMGVPIDRGLTQESIC